MEDPQVIIEKLKIAQTYTNSALTVQRYDVGDLGASLDSQTKAWLNTFNEVYKGVAT